MLFIDEAYSLYHGEDDTKDFGREALDTLIAEMENHRSDFVVIMAGYIIDGLTGRGTPTGDASETVLQFLNGNIIAEDGTIDVDNDILSILDILIVGYHKMIKTDFAGFFGGQEKTKDAIQKCTNAYLNALEKYPITIISHLDSVLTTDLYQIGLACKEKGVMVEINNRHTNWNDDQVNDLLAADCMFLTIFHSTVKLPGVSIVLTYCRSSHNYHLPKGR